MNFSNKEVPEPDRIELEAAEWLARMDDGLTGEEQDAYIEWLSRDERHRKAIALIRWGWGELDRLAGLQSSHQAAVNPQLLEPASNDGQKSGWITRKRALSAAIGLAAVVIFSIAGTVFLKPDPTDGMDFQPAYELMERLVSRELPDGSRVELNRGAVLETRFTREKRLVLLEGGEANFIVAKDPHRPFVVAVGGVEVKAVGTVFNVKYIGQTVDVIVTEGKVQVDHDPGLKIEQEVGSATPLLTAGQKATIQIESGRPKVTLQQLDKEDIEEALKWQPRLLKYNAAPLREIIQGFNRHNQIQVELGDQQLGQIILTSAFWSDNVEGFVRLMENNFGVKVVWVDRYRIRLVQDEKTVSSL